MHILQIMPAPPDLWVLRDTGFSRAAGIALVQRGENQVVIPMVFDGTEIKPIFAKTVISRWRPEDGS